MGLANVLTYVTEQVPVTETYINISNAYSYFGSNEESANYATGAVQHAAKCTDMITARFDSADVS